MRLPVRIGLVLLAAVCPIGIASVARAAPAIVEPFEIQVDMLPTAVLPECLDETVGSQVGTETISVLYVANDNGQHYLRGLTTLEYRVTFSDGRYVTGTSTEHFNSNVNAVGLTTTNTTVIREVRTIFDATGEPTGSVVIHAVSHLTYKDRNEDASPSPGEISASVDRFFFTCR